MIVFWDHEREEHIGCRSERHPGAIGIELDWVDEAVGDRNALVIDPDPRSGPPVLRLVGYSTSAGFVITVLAERSDGEYWRRTDPGLACTLM